MLNSVFLKGYNEWRKICGLNYANTFDELSNEIKNQTIRRKLKELYGHPSNIGLMIFKS